MPWNCLVVGRRRPSKWAWLTWDANKVKPAKSLILEEQ